jgi:hypothetical protein
MYIKVFICTNLTFFLSTEVSTKDSLKDDGETTQSSSRWQDGLGPGEIAMRSTRWSHSELMNIELL